jgi:hypothetical protein
MDMPDPRLSRRLQRTLLAFFLLAALFLAVVSATAPSVYAKALLLGSPLTERSPAAATLVLVGLGGMPVFLLVGVLRRWHWVFWLVLVATGSMILDIPATILQMMGILPALFPLWYSLCRMGASLIAVGMCVWMLHIYRHHGVWAMEYHRRKPQRPD